MVETLIPWATTVMGATIIWLAGRGPKARRVAWWCGLANQALWISFALVTGAYGFIAGSLIYGGVYARHLQKGH